MSRPEDSPLEPVKYRVRVEILDGDDEVVGTVMVEGGRPEENATLEVTGVCALGADTPLATATFFLTLSNDIKQTGRMEGKLDA
jgi:hypothetical protein